MKLSDTYYKERGVRPEYRKLLNLKAFRGKFTQPWFDADGKESFRQTRYIPAIEIDGKETKSTVPKGTEMDFNYLPLIDDRNWRDICKDPSVPLVIAEAMTKAAALAQMGYPSLTTGGVRNHRSKKRRNGFIRGLDSINWTGRLVRILFDNDIYENTDVQDGLFEIGAELAARGAIVETVLLPRPKWDNESRKLIKIGIDDFVASFKTLAEAEAAVEALPVLKLDDPELADWGKWKHPPKPSITDGLDFSPRPLSVFTESPPPRKYVLDRLIGEQQLAYLVAAGGTGKGYLTLDLAMHIGIGEPWMGMPVKQGTVVLLCLEDSIEEVDRRMHFTVKLYAKSMGIADDSKEFRHLAKKVAKNVRYVSLEGLPPLHLIEEDRNKQIVWTLELPKLAAKLKALNPVLVIPDPLTYLHSLDENSNSVGTAMTSALAHIRTVAKTALLVAAHVSKDAANKSSAKINSGADELTIESQAILRGAISFATGARSVIALVGFDPAGAAKRFQVEARNSLDRFAKVMHVKCNYGPKADVIYLEREMVSGVFQKHDPLITPFRAKGEDDVETWRDQLSTWLAKKKRTAFSKTEVTQNDKTRAAIFGNFTSRTAATKYFETGIVNDIIVALTKAEIAELPAKEQQGGGTRYRLFVVGDAE